MKYTVSFIVIIFTKIAFAQVLFVNTSNTNDMEITYRFCHYYYPEQNNNYYNGCFSSSLTSITVKSRKNSSEKNQVIFDVTPDNIHDQTNMVEIVSVVEKDQQENIIASANFTTKLDTKHSSCKGEHKMLIEGENGSKDTNLAFIFSDNKNLPIILCHTENF